MSRNAIEQGRGRSPLLTSRPQFEQRNNITPSKRWHKNDILIVKNGPKKPRSRYK